MTARQRKSESTAFSFSEFARGLGEKLQGQASRPNILAYSPHDKQIRFHSSQKRHRLYIGGNRSGKTTGGIVEDLMWLRGEHPYRELPPGGVRGRIVAVDFLNGIEKIIIPEIKRWCPMSYLRGGTWTDAFDTQERVLNFENGSFVELMSYDQDVDKFAGTSRHFIHFDEEPPQDIYIECIARLVDTGGSWWMTLTPVMGMQWMYDEIYMPGKNDPNSQIDVIEVEMWENPFLSPNEVTNFLNSLPSEDRDARVAGKFTRRGGVILKKFDRKIHVIPADSFELPPYGIGELYASLDHGYNAPTAWLWHYVDPDGNITTFAEHYEAEMTVEEHAAVVKTMEGTFKRIPIIRVGDPAIAQRNGATGDSIQAQYALNDIEVILGNNDVIAGINKMNSYLNYTEDRLPRWHITDNCENFLKEIPKYRWKTWSNKKSERDNNVYDIPHKKDDHACDSARYFFMLMPDLTPIAKTPPKKELELPVPVAHVAKVPIIDKRAAMHKPKIDGDWFIQGADDVMGGEW
jgi:phage terminase large subunit-like protein